MRKTFNQDGLIGSRLPSTRVGNKTKRKCVYILSRGRLMHYRAWLKVGTAVVLPSNLFLSKGHILQQRYCSSQSSSSSSSAMDKRPLKPNREKTLFISMWFTLWINSYCSVNVEDILRVHLTEPQTNPNNNNSNKSRENNSCISHWCW